MRNALIIVFSILLSGPVAAGSGLDEQDVDASVTPQGGLQIEI